MVGFWQMLQSCISSYLLNHLMAYQTAEALGRPIQKKINVFLSKLSHCHAHDFYRKSFTTWSKIVHKKSQKMTTWKRLKISLKVQRCFFDQSRLKNPCLVCNYVHVNLLGGFSCFFSMPESFLWYVWNVTEQRFAPAVQQCAGPGTRTVVCTFPTFGRKLADFEYKVFSLINFVNLLHPQHLFFSCHFLEKSWQNNPFHM